MKPLLCPDAPPPVVVTVMSDPAVVSVMVRVLTPFTKVPVFAGLTVPIDALRLFEPP